MALSKSPSSPSLTTGMTSRDSPNGSLPAETLPLLNRSTNSHDNFVDRMNESRFNGYGGRGSSPNRWAPRGPDQREQLRRKSVSVLEMTRQGYVQPEQRPFFHRLLSNHATVLNPNWGSTHDLTSQSLLFTDENLVHSLDMEENGEFDPKQRMSILSVLRPEKLIGEYKTVATWQDRLVDVLKIRNKKLKTFYTEQNELIERYIEIDNLLDYGKIHLSMLSTYTEPKKKKLPVLDEAAEDLLPPVTSLEMGQSPSNSRLNGAPGNIQQGSQYLGFNEELASREIYTAIVVNFFINFILLLGKLIIAFLTDSLSIVASLVDSVLDFLSTFIIYVANKLSTTENWQLRLAYPIGRAKLEPLGILVFSVLIIVSFFQVGLESFKKLFLTTPDERVVVLIGNDAILIMLITILAKVGCWLWCKSSKSSSVQALAQDAMTDIVFNTVSLVMPTAGHFLGIWWLDPAGAFLLSFYVIFSWGKTAYEHIDNLTGAVAEPMDYKIILYLAYRFAECIELVTALKVYHAGDLLNVEIDLVFNTTDFDLTFKDAHDIAEALQYAIETLPMVERAYVHIDYMEGNFKGHLT